MIVGTLGIKRIKFIFISCIKSWEGGKNEFQVKGMCKRFLGGEYKNFHLINFNLITGCLIEVQLQFQCLNEIA